MGVAGVGGGARELMRRLASFVRLAQRLEIVPIEAPVAPTDRNDVVDFDGRDVAPPLATGVFVTESTVCEVRANGPPWRRRARFGPRFRGSSTG